MSEADVAARFDALQRKLVPLWTSIQTITQDAQTIVVVPSITHRLRRSAAPGSRPTKSASCSCCCCSASRARALVYVTSQAIHPSIIDYYLDLLPGVLASHAQQATVPGLAARRVVAAADRKLLERPRLISRSAR